MKQNLKIKKIPYRKIMYALAFSAMTLSFTACEKDYDYVEPAPAPGTPVDSVSFSTDVYPIFTANCNNGGCHAAGANTPDLSTVSIAYTELYSNGLIDTTNGGANAANSELYVRMTSVSDPMPPQGILASTTTNKVLNWIKQGGLNN